jgi:hypothetical protein
MKLNTNHFFKKEQKKIQSQIELIFETHDLNHETKITP